MSLNNLKSVVKSLRYNYWLSRIAFLVLYPIVKAGKISEWLKFQLKINGTKLVYDGVALNFPKNIGVNTATKIYWKGDDGFESYVWKTMKSLIRGSSVFFDIGS